MALRIYRIAVFAAGNGVADTLLTCCATLIVKMQPLPGKLREAAAFILHIKQDAAVAYRGHSRNLSERTAQLLGILQQIVQCGRQNCAVDAHLHSTETRRDV